MSTGPTQRSQWQIDRTLASLIGANIRVAVRSFAPPSATAEPAPIILVRHLFLPDNTQPSGLPVFFEGRLRQFERHIGIVFVWLESPSPLMTKEGSVFFRGKTAVILRGPAVVELDYPFRVERLPDDPDNYWRDLRVPRAQFEFLFPR